MTDIPGYWMNETSGVLRPAVMAYLEGSRMTPDQIAAMRAYLRQWIMAPGFIGPAVQRLREAIDRIATQADIREWIIDAAYDGIDPL